MTPQQNSPPFSAYTPPVAKVPMGVDPVVWMVAASPKAKTMDRTDLGERLAARLTDMAEKQGVETAVEQVNLFLRDRHMEEEMIHLEELAATEEEEMKGLPTLGDKIMGLEMITGRHLQLPPKMTMKAATKAMIAKAEKMEVQDWMEAVMEPDEATPPPPGEAGTPLPGWSHEEIKALIKAKIEKIKQKNKHVGDGTSTGSGAGGSIGVGWDGPGEHPEDDPFA